MAEVTREIVHDGTAKAWVAWLALILSIIALALAWMAYNRTGQDIETRIQQEVNRAVDEVQGQR